MINRRALFPLLFLLMLTWLTGCAPSAFPVVWQDPATDWTYPEPPEQPRVRYLRKVSGLADVREAEGTGKLFLKWLGGDDVVQMPMLSPYAVAADGAGRIWMTDPSLGLLYHIDLAYQKIDYFSILSGRRLVTPTGVAFDRKQQRLYLANAGSLEVLVLDAEHNYLLSLKPPEGFSRPGGMTVDAAGNLYVTDVLKGTVEVFSVGGRYLKTLGSRLTADGRFNHPSNVAVDSDGRVYVVDSFNFRVEILGVDGEPPAFIGGLGDSTGSFARPRGIALDSFGNLYVSDAAFDNVQVFNRNGELLLVFGRPGKGPDSFCMPAGLAFDPEDRLYVADNCAHQVKIFQFLGD